MGWVRLEDGYPEHPKIVEAGPLAMAMDVAGVAYCNRQLTDGFIPRAATRRLLDLTEFGVTAEDLVKRLIVAGRWVEEEDGYRVHDFLEYQPSRSQVQSLSTKRAEAGRKGAAKRWHTDNGVSDETLEVVAKVQRTLLSDDRWTSEDVQVGIDELRKRLETGEKITSPVNFAGNVAEKARRARLANVRRAAQEKADIEERMRGEGLDKCEHDRVRRECNDCAEATRKAAEAALSKLKGGES